MEYDGQEDSLNDSISLVIDRFEENFAVCENQESEEMVNIQRNLIPENAIEGMTIKKIEDKYVVDYENCIVSRKLIIDNLKNKWIKENGIEYYMVSSVLDTAVKCTNILAQQNIYINDQEIINSAKKGDIIKVIDGKYIIDQEKNCEIENEIQKLLK